MRRSAGLLQRALMVGTLLLPGLTAQAQEFGPEIRIGDYGDVPALAFAPDGTGHVVYRRATTILYRFYDGTSWGVERQISNANSKAEAEFLDRNQPKITRDPTGAAWIVWGGQVRDKDKNLYLRGINADGTIRTVVKAYKYNPTLLNPEEVAVAYDTTNNRLHLYGIYVGDPTKRQDGHYDITLNPETLAVVGDVTKLGGPQKNIYGFTAPNRAFAFARLHNCRFFRSTNAGEYVQYGIKPTLLQYSVGAMRFFALDDRIVHFGIVSTQPQLPSRRDVTYLRYDIDAKTNLEEVMIDPDYGSKYGLVHPAVTASGNIFLTWDTDRPGAKQAPAYAYRRAGAPLNSAFAGPFLIPDYPPAGGLGDAHAPAAWPVGESIVVVWGDEVRNGLFSRVFTFGEPGPVSALTGAPAILLVVGAAVAAMFSLRRRSA